MNEKVLVDAKDATTGQVITIQILLILNLDTVKLILMFLIQKKYEIISKTQLKKLKNFLEAESRKDASKNAKEVKIHLLFKLQYLFECMYKILFSAEKRAKI